NPSRRSLRRARQRATAAAPCRRRTPIRACRARACPAAPAPRRCSTTPRSCDSCERARAAARPTRETRARQASPACTSTTAARSCAALLDEDTVLDLLARVENDRVARFETLEQLGVHAVVAPDAHGREHGRAVDDA